MGTSEGMSPERIRDLYERRGKDFGTRELDVATRAAADGLIPLTMSSETPVLRYDWWTDTEYYEVLDHGQVDLGYARDGLPFCVDHDTGEQIGLVVNVGVDKKSRLLDGDVKQGNNPDAAWRFQDIRDGIRPKVSIGYIRGDYTVEKQNGNEPETRRYAFTPIECSTVPIPADYEVGFGRSLLRALRTANDRSPDTVAARKGKEQEMADSPAAPASGVNEALEAELERQENLRTYADANAVDSSTVLEWMKDRKFTLAQAKEFVRNDLAKQVKTETGRIRSDGPDIHISSGKGPLDRTGKPKDGVAGGFETAGDYFRAVLQAETQGRIDPRLLEARAVASGQSEAVSSDGGFLVPPQFLTDITAPLYESGDVLSRVRRIPLSGNTLEVTVIDETSRADGSRFGAISSGWGDEVDTVTAGKVKLRRHRYNTKKLIGLGYVTEEEQEDSPAMAAILGMAFREELGFQAENAIINGNGNGQPLGLLNSPATVQNAIESGQSIATTAASIATNVAKMMTRMPPPLFKDSVWLINIGIMPKLITATLGGTSAAMPIFLPGGNISGAPFGTLLGRPIVPVEYCAAEGTPGDIILVNLNEYIVAEKSSGLSMTSSVHVRFLQGEQAFRFVWRLDGAPRWRLPITPYKGSNTVGPFVTLGTRS